MKLNKQFSLELEVIQALDKLAKESGRPVSHIVQDACVEHVRRSEERKRELSLAAAKAAS